MHECVINCGGAATTISNITPDTTEPSLVPRLIETKPPFSFPQHTAAPPSVTKRILQLTTEALGERRITTETAARALPSMASLTRAAANRSAVTRPPKEIAFTSISLPSISPCGMRPDAGSCNSYIYRYHFDALDQTCKKFRFSGCGGNGNNFMTGENCVKNCGGNVEDQHNLRSTKHITERLVLPTMKTTTTTPRPTTEDPVRKRKMKRVKVERRPIETRNRAILNRARLRSRMSSSSTMVSSSTSSISASENELEVPRSFRRPARMVSSAHNTSILEQQLLAARTDLYPPRARHKEYAGLNRRVDEVMKAPPNMKGGLMVIRSYCRYPPDEAQDGALCPRPSPADFYFYNVATASCDAMPGSLCTKSRNRFSSKRSCLKACIVQ